MVDVLPRSFDQMLTVQLKLKRRLEYKSDYMFETISPKAIYDALVFLVSQELYQKHKIRVDKNVMERYASSKQPINFVVEPEDENIFNEISVIKEETKVNLDDDTKETDSSDSESESDGKSGKKCSNKTLTL